MEREGRYTPPAPAPAPWPSEPGGRRYTDAEVEALLAEVKGDSRGIGIVYLDPLLDRVGLIDITRETHTVAESIGRHLGGSTLIHAPHPSVRVPAHRS